MSIRKQSKRNFVQTVSRSKASRHHLCWLSKMIQFSPLGKLRNICAAHQCSDIVAAHSDGGNKELSHRQALEVPEIPTLGILNSGVPLCAIHGTTRGEDEKCTRGKDRRNDISRETP